MRFLSLVINALPLTGLASATPAPAAAVEEDPIEVAASRRVVKLHRTYQKNILDSIKHRKAGCTEKKLLRRQEWGTLSHQSRLEYISAVYCLSNLTTHPSLTNNRSQIPGALTRYDDFVHTHIAQTPLVHNNGLFLGFHRQFIHLYERALRTECNYTGAQPYWDSSLSYLDPRNSTVFDGSPFSMGSNGLFIPNRPNTTIPLPAGGSLSFPPATGGGCVFSGPFSPDTGFVIRLGPVGLEPKGPMEGMGNNERCLSRDLSLVYSSNCRPSNVSSLVGGNCEDLECFNRVLDSSPEGIHGAGHFAMGPVAMDVYSSPNDPAFWLHHANVDRLWAMWQGQDRKGGRVGLVWGTGTSYDVPPSPNVTLDSPINFGVVGAPKTLGDVVSSVDGDLCYIYD